MILIAVPVWVVIAAGVILSWREFLGHVAEYSAPLPLVAWDPSWPDLPVVNVPNGLRRDVARSLYAFAGRNPEILRYIPCYCGCRAQGHRSNLDCYVRQRSADGRITAWQPHGFTCPVGHDITGDVTLWHDQGMSLSAIRDEIDHEFAERGPQTPTEKPPKP